MNRRVRIAVFVVSALAVLRGIPALAAETRETPSPHLKVVKLDPGDKTYLVLLSGPPETGSMRSGLVTLAPGRSIGVHNTERNEEMLVPLEGEGELRITGKPPVRIMPGLITYAPSHTEHDVTNTGSKPLRYIFIVARVE